ncbi:hypothetical protein PTI98_011585, partial [Pleurotus ostreatus]
LAALVNIVELHQLILNELSLADLRAYGLSCKTIMKDVDEYIERAYNIERLLMNFLPQEHIGDFRMVQGAIGMIIGGSSALQFFSRRYYDDSDLDLYVCAFFGSCAARMLEHVKFATFFKEIP